MNHMALRLTMMPTIEATLPHVSIGREVVNMDRVALNQLRDVEFSGSSFLILTCTKYHEHSLKVVFANIVVDQWPALHPRSTSMRS
jgi:hypothetical protein